MPHFSFAEIQQAAQTETYWRDTLDESTPPIFLPLDYGMSPTGAYQPAEVPLQLAPELCTRLLKISRNKDMPLFLILLTALKGLLYRYHGTTDWLLATPPCQPAEPASDGLVFVRTPIDAKDSFKSLLLRVREHALKAYGHQNYAVYALLKALKPGNTADAFCRVACLLENIHGRDWPIHQQVHQTVRLVFRRDQEHIQGRIIFDASQYAPATLTRFERHYQMFLDEALKQMDRAITDLPLLTSAEKDGIADFSAGPRSVVPDLSLDGLLQRQVRAAPDHAAVVTAAQHWTYQQLNRNADSIAAFLQEQAGPEGTRRVGLLLARSAWAVAAVWGVLKAGFTLVPLDGAYPVERLHFMLEDSQCDLLLVENQTQDILAFSPDSRIRQANVETLPDAATPPGCSTPAWEQLAYIIYTSGSTGRPKGVAVGYGALRNMLHNVKQALYARLPAMLREALLAPLIFDVGLKQILATTVWGHTLYLPDDDTRRDAGLCLRYLAENGIHLFDITPAFLGALLEVGMGETPPPDLLHVMIGSEAVPWTLIRELHQHAACTHISISNFYGPTETCVEVTVFHIDPAAVQQNGTVPVGRPLPNCEVHILDAAQQPQPIGIPGEIFIGGLNLAQAYVNNAALTQERFVDQMAAPGRRLYRTGDRGRWLADGNIEFLGRMDDQVKIRGYRIEPAEIVRRLQQHASVREAVVLARQISAQDMALVAWVTGATREPDAAALRRHLQTVLPDYMVPQHIVVLAGMPLTSAGKIDTRALPQPASLTAIASSEALPRTQLEQNMATIWQEVLERPALGIHDNFFELGGHSIKATRLASRIHKKLGLEIRLRDIFQYPTIAGLAEHIANRDQTAITLIQPAPRQPHYPLSHAQTRLWLFEQMHGPSAVYNISGCFMLEGPFDSAMFQQALAGVVARHESLRTDFISVDGQPRQRVHDKVVADAPVLNLAGDASWQERLRAIAAAESQTPFDITQAPLLRARLVQCAPQQHAMMVSLHHIVCDGWSVDIFAEELFTLYQAFCARQPDPLPPLSIQYKDYTIWQNNLLAGPECDRLRQFWRARLQKLPPNLEVPTDYPRPEAKTYPGDTVVLALQASQRIALEDLIRSCQASLFMGLIALVKCLLHGYTGQTDLVLGVSMAGRVEPVLEKQIGFFVNVLPLRTTIPAEGGFRELLGQVKTGAAELYDHQLYPFDRLVEDLALPRDVNRLPLFDIAIDFQEAEKLTSRVTGLHIRDLEAELQFCKYDLLFLFVEKPNRLELALQYNTDLYRETTIQTILQQLVSLIGQVLENPDIKLSDMVLEGRAEAVVEEIVTQFNF